MTNARLRQFTSGSVLLVLALTISGCGRADDPTGNGAFAPSGSPPPQSPVSVASPLTTPTLGKRQVDKIVLAQYRKYQQLYRKAYATGNASDLAEVAADPLLTIVTDDVEAMNTKGTVLRFTNVLNPKVISRAVDFTSVVVRDCVRTIAAHTFDAKTGKKLKSVPGTTFDYQARFRFDGTTWKITEARRGKPC
ncbi:hypothetical protein LO762_01920 [Actinocorallia sp. API 0066]|uniref:hypothetical protein n=1 Tax=Actinocorallia sp. API 0066 TaxID=2896846 RepID=UPI001E40EA64|nr:hypothetical protein [Actinocorallia sp. API 0066]MCD0447957.1 hypothetical protein [Actinocorallia sp. API 0066]